MKKNLPIIFAVLIVGAIVILTSHFEQKNVSSVNYGNEYHATTTSSGRFPTVATLQTDSTTLGSVIVTGSAAGTLDIYDATTTNVSLRAAKFASSSILVASFPTGMATGTYQFDQTLYQGLTVVSTGQMATSTITYR